MAFASSPVSRVPHRQPAFAGTCLSAEADRQAGNWFAYFALKYSNQYIFYDRRKSAETCLGRCLEGNASTGFAVPGLGFAPGRPEVREAKRSWARASEVSAQAVSGPEVPKFG